MNLEDLEFIRAYNHAQPVRSAKPWEEFGSPINDAELEVFNRLEAQEKAKLRAKKIRDTTWTHWNGKPY